MEKKSIFAYDFESLKGKKAVVVGDLIIDYYRVLKEKKLSPEAPVIVFSPVKEDMRAGGAANVANNLAALGFDSELFTAMGNRDKDEKFKNYLGLMPFKTFSVVKSETTVKERLATSRQPIVRIDSQSTDFLDPKEEKILHDEFVSRINEFSVVVFSDYAQGVLSQDLVQKMINVCLASNKPVIVNTKSRDYLKYKGASICTFNHNEAKEITGLVEFEEEHVAKYLLKAINPKGAVAVTMGSQGILLCTEKGPSVYPVVDSREDEVIDVTGAGDTVTAAIAAGIVMGLDYSQLMLLSNIAASIVIKRRGTSSVSSGEINKVKEKINA